MRKGILFVLLMLLAMGSMAQYRFPQEDFVPPLSGPLKVSGTFAELRPNHFHSGIDFSTGGKIGRDVLAIADGYISRVVISSSGYGKVIYITHPNGYMSVYGHLHKFLPSLDSLLSALQEQHQDFNVHEYFLADDFPVKQGQIIGISGNSGRSYGPHLHFEIRDALNEHPLNPEKFGFNIGDASAPAIKGLVLVEKQTCSDGFTTEKEQFFKLKYLSNNRYEVYSSLSTYSSYYYFAIKTQDGQFSKNENNGIYSIKLFERSGTERSLVYHCAFDELNFNYSRDVNAVMHWDLKKEGKGTHYKCYSDPGIRIPILIDSDNKGLIVNEGSGMHYFEMVVADASGNKSVINFRVNQKEVSSQEVNCSPGFLKQGEALDFESDGLELKIDGNEFFNDVELNYSNPQERVYDLNSKAYALADYLEFKIPAVADDEQYFNKSLAKIQYYKSSRYIPLELKDGYLSGSTRVLGDISVVVDSIPPSLSVGKGFDSKIYGVGDELYIYTKDKISGIGRYEVLLNGTWIYSEYNSIRNYIKAVIPNRYSLEANSLQVRIWDDAGNLKEETFKIKIN